MLSKKVRRIIDVAVVTTIIGLAGGLSHTITEGVKAKEEKVQLEQRLGELLGKLDSAEKELSNAKSTIVRATTPEFRVYTPAGVDLTVTTALVEEEGSYYADVKITGVSTTASMASNFMVEGSRYSLNLADFDLLARTVRAETGGMSHEANVATANVVFNRLDSDLYPSSMWDVIHQPYQFEVVDVGTYNQPPTEKAIRATADAMNGVDVVPNALGFWNAEIVPRGHELWQYPIAYRIDEHVYSTLQR